MRGSLARKLSWVLIVILLGVAVVAPVTEGAEKYFPLDKVKPGLNGDAFTVFSGTKIESFRVTVIDVVDNGTTHGKLILVRLSGKNISESGGLAAGMSGSPVYIGNQLLGAISYGFENADPMLAMVTPIESMLELWNKRTAAVNPYPARAEYPSDLFKKFAPRISGIPANAPVMVSGMGPRGFEMVRSLFNKAGLPLVVNIGSRARNSNNSAPPLQPGSAIAIQMVQGDYQVAAIGTVTLVDGNRFLAFGHQFTNRGAVDYLAYQANIYQIVKSAAMSFKMGAATQLTGRILQDRQAGIAGRIGEYPPMVDVQVYVNDMDQSRRGTYHFQVIRDEQSLADLVVAGVTDAIDKYIDRVGTGTGKVGVQISADRAVINRDNMFFSKDIAVAASADLRDALELMTSNEFTSLYIRNINVRLDVTKQQQTARIYKLEAAKTTVRPGETVQLNATLRSFRGEPFKVAFQVKLPDKLHAGKLLFTVRSEAKSSGEDEDPSAKRANSKQEERDFDSLAELIKDFNETPKNNEIILEYNPYNMEGDSASGNAGTEKTNPETKPVQLRETTGYYLLGQAETTLEVKN